MIKAYSVFSSLLSPPSTGGESNEYGVERDPWFDRPFDRLTVLSKVEGLTTLSEVEGESREIPEIQFTLDLPTPLAGDDDI